MWNSRLKISQSDYFKLSKLIHETMDNNHIMNRAAYDITITRYLWDIYHSTLDRLQTKKEIESYLFMRRLYDYLNDNHLESALKAILHQYI